VARRARVHRLLAASLVSFHSAFQLRTPIAATSAASLALVVLSGLIGWFLYALAPAGARASSLGGKRLFLL
jgi:hypothetical protein